MNAKVIRGKKKLAHKKIHPHHEEAERLEGTLSGKGAQGHPGQPGAVRLVWGQTGAGCVEYNFIVFSL